MTFYATELELDPAFGWEGGPSSDVRIKTLRNRHERRNRPSDLIQHNYRLPFQNVTDRAYLEYVKSAYMAMGGPHDTFLAKDYGDFRHGFGALPQAPMPFGVGDGVTTVFQLSKRYTFGDAFYDRPITKPKDGHVIYLDNVADLVTADLLTGEVDFGTSPPGVGVILSWTGEYRVTVRFADFQLNSTIDNRFGAGGDFAVNGGCSLIEVFGE